MRMLADGAVWGCSGGSWAGMLFPWALGPCPVQELCGEWPSSGSSGRSCLSSLSFTPCLGQGGAGSQCPGVGLGLLTADPEPWGSCSPSMVPCSAPRNAKEMPAAVAEALQSVLQLAGGLSPSEAQEHLTALERSQRFQSETWS